MKIISGFFKLITTIVAIILILALLLVVASLFLTPSILGLESLEINGVTLEQQGLADESFFRIGKIAIGILNAPEEEHVDGDTYTAVLDKLPEVASSSSSASTSESKETSLSGLLEGKVIFEEAVEIEASGSELAAIFNMAFGSVDVSTLTSLSAYSNVDLAGVTFEVPSTSDVQYQKVTLASTSIDESDLILSETAILQLMQEYSCRFISITPSVSGSNIKMSTALALSLPSNIVNEINSYGVITVSEEVYIYFDSMYSIVDEQLATIEFDESTLQINALSVEDTALITASLVSIMTGEAVDSDEVLESYNNELSDILAAVINNLGKVQGMQNNNLVLVTHAN